MKGALKRKIGLLINGGFFLVVGLLLVLGIVSQNDMKKARMYEDSEIHTYQVMIQIERLFSKLKDAENAQRGYLFTKDSSYLRLYSQAKNDVIHLQDKVKILTADNFSQVERLNEIDILINQSFGIYNENINLIKQNKTAQAIAVVRSKREKIIMDKIRLIIADAEEEEGNLLKQRSSFKKAFQIDYSVFLMTGSIFVLLNIVFIYFLEEAFRESTQKYKALLNTLFEAYATIEVIFDKQGRPVDYRFLEINQNFEKSSGLHDAQGKLMRDLQPDLEQHWFDIYGRIATTGLPEHFENDSKALGRFFEVSAFKLGRRKSKKVGILFRDITERKRAEEELRKSKNLLELLIQNTASAIVLLDSTGSIIVYNPAFLKMLQLDEIIHSETIFDQKWKEWEYYDEQENLIPFEERPSIRALRTGERILNEIMGMKSPSGQMIWFSATMEPIFDRQGRIEMVICSYYDLTPLRQATEALKQSEQRWITTLSSIGDAVIATDAEGRITILNSEAEHLTGWSREEALGRPVESVFKIIDEMNPLTDLLEGKQKTGSTNHSILFTKNGHEIPIENNGTPITMNGQTIGVVLVFRDISERKKFERHLKFYNTFLEEMVKARTAELEKAKLKAEESDRLKSVFLATMSHELRTPLNSIIGFAGILLKEYAGPLNEEQKKQVSMLQSSGRHLLSIINDIMDLTSIQAGELPVSPKPFDIGAVIRNVVESELPKANDKGLSLIVEELPEIKEIVSDPQRVHQILVNIVHNAVKFTDQGSIRIKSFYENDWVKIIVTDTGPGIEQENLERLFTPFVQIDNDLVRRHPGTGSGLGLSICKKLLDLLHGEISVESTFGVGSTFTVSLPGSAF